uniref:Tetraspanin n=1 Tax=Spodoptera frugiperda TaxID=7108 RepID=A0A2H1VAS9_SPOFR
MCRCLAKYILFAVNLILTLLGLFLIGFGIFIKIQYNKMLDDVLGIELDQDYAPIFVICIGVIVAIISMFGCCGAIAESRKTLKSYAVFMGILAVCKIAFTIYLFVAMSEVKDSLQRNVEQHFNDPGQNVAFHALEATFKCCGTTGPESYINNNNLAAPTCCDKFNKDPTTTDDANRICSINEAYPVGCTRFIGDLIYNFLRTVAFILIGFIVFELMAMLLALYVAATIPLPVVNPPTIYYSY